ncbi:hypothetical protein Peur_071766 [Populus x canadensis]
MGKGGGPNLRRQKRITKIKSEDQRQEDTILATKKGSRRNENLRHEEKRRVKTKLSETGATEMENTNTTFPVEPVNGTGTCDEAYDTLLYPKIEKMDDDILSMLSVKNVSVSFLATAKPKDAALMTSQANGAFTTLCALGADYRAFYNAMTSYPIFFFVWNSLLQRGAKEQYGRCEIGVLS